MKNEYLAHKNNLLQARRRSKLVPKQIAFLLSKKTTDEIYRYENAAIFPNLPTALKLEIIYKTPVRFLFQDLFGALEKEIAEQRESQSEKFYAQSEPFLSRAEKLNMEEECFYSGILKKRFPSPMEIRQINAHIINLSNTLSDVKQGLSPFEKGQI